MCSRKRKRESGQGLVEYSLIILLVAIAVVGGVTAFGSALGSLIGSFGSAF